MNTNLFLCDDGHCMRPGNIKLDSLLDNLVIEGGHIVNPLINKTKD